MDGMMSNAMNDNDKTYKKSRYNTILTVLNCSISSSRRSSASISDGGLPDILAM